MFNAKKVKMKFIFEVENLTLCNSNDEAYKDLYKEVENNLKGNYTIKKFELKKYDIKDIIVERALN